MANTFTYNYKPLDYATAQKQAAQQVDPLYNRAIQGVNQQKYANDVQAGQVAAARGMGHSGLAADQLNKIAIAAQGNVADLNAQRATQIAQQANDNVWQDKNYSLQNRAQLYNEFNSNRSYDYQTGRDKIADTRYNNEWAYQKGRDKVSDNQWNKQYNRGVLESDRSYNYQVGRDKVSDNQWQKSYDYNKSVDTRNYNYQKGVDTRNYNYQKSRDKVSDYWTKQQWEKMSPAEKARAKMDAKNAAAQSQAEMDYYGNFTGNAKGVDVQGDGWVPNSKDYQITSPYGGRIDPITGKSDNHRGIDIAVPKNTPIGSEVSGKVVSTSGDKSYGNTVVIQDSNGFLHRYAHLNSINVRVGDDVAKGSLVGRSGNTGRVSGAGGGYHLHYEVTDSKGRLVNPTLFMSGGKYAKEPSGSVKITGGGNYNNYWKTQKEAAKAPGFNTFMGGLNKNLKSGKVPMSWAKALIEIAGRESTWNYNASNGSHFGYGQFTNGNIKTYSKYGNYGNPADQIVMMYHYAKDRYGSPAKALNFWDKHNWW